MFAAERLQFQETIAQRNKDISALEDDVAVFRKHIKTQEGIFLQNEKELRMQIKYLESENTAKISEL